MILTTEQLEKLKEATKPLMKFLNDENFHPHIAVIVDQDSAEFFESSARIVNDEFLKD